MTSVRLLASILVLTAFAVPAHAQRSAAFGNTVANMAITEAEVQAAQEAWGQALISISKEGAKSQKAAAKLAEKVLDTAYGYNLGPVLFKPTLTHGEQTYRTTREGALAYFVGGNKKYPNDNGFALKGWEKYEFKNAAVQIHGDLALTMGNVMLTDKTGKVTTVNKTWGFKKDDQGKLRIVLHHSSLPFQPAN